MSVWGLSWLLIGGEGPSPLWMEPFLSSGAQNYETRERQWKLASKQTQWWVHQVLSVLDCEWGMTNCLSSYLEFSSTMGWNVKQWSEQILSSLMLFGVRMFVVVWVRTVPSGLMLVSLFGKVMEPLGGVNVMIFKWIAAYLADFQFQFEILKLNGMLWTLK